MVFKILYVWINDEHVGHAALFWRFLAFRRSGSFLQPAKPVHLTCRQIFYDPLAHRASPIIASLPRLMVRGLPDLLPSRSNPKAVCHTIVDARSNRCTRSAHLVLECRHRQAEQELFVKCFSLA
jgi:hypothetical protein